MAQADWADLSGSALDSTDVPRGVTAALTVPPGGTAFTYGFRSEVSTIGFAGKYCALTNFSPITGSRKGGSIRCAIKRYASGANFAPMFGFIQGVDPTTSSGYMVGLSEADAYNIVLKKGVPSGGLDASGSDIIRASTASWTAVGDGVTVWKHLRLDVLVNPHDEVVLNVYENDLTANDVDAPVWAAITGMDSFIDDANGILTGSLPYTGPFYPFFGMYTEGVGVSVLYDHFEVLRQTAP